MSERVVAVPDVLTVGGR